MIRSMSIRAGIAIALATAAAPPAWAEQVRFTGNTTVDATVIRDALHNILRIGAASEQCNSMTAVEAFVLPQDYRLPEAYRVAPSNARYERWDVTLCGRVVPFLLGFWSPPEGGTMFQIGHPFPGDPPAEIPRSH